MRNDSANWTPAAPLARAPVEIAETRLEVIVPERQTLLSGSIGALLEMSGVETATGWPKPATGESYALCLRRDRILRVNGTALEDGWYEAVGVAVSDMTDGYAVIQVSGPSALSVLKRGTEIDPSEPSAATARLFGGYGVILYAYETPDQFRLHVARGHIEGLWDLLQTYASQAAAV